MFFQKRPWFAAMLLQLALLPGLNAQIRSGTITGSVLDPSGGVIPDAVVVITNTGTSVSSLTKSSRSGVYTVPYLEAGTYSVAVNKPGFQPFQESGVHLEAAQPRRVDASLRLGSTGTKVEVVASVEQLQADSSTVSGTVSSQVIDAIPMSRRILCFMLLFKTESSRGTRRRTAPRWVRSGSAWLAAPSSPHTA